MGPQTPDFNEEVKSMDTYHKVLAIILEETGGDDLVDVDLTLLLKKAGYLPSLDEICNHLKAESWVTESRPNVVRITHWGVAEAKKAGSVRPDAARVLERDSRRLLSETREFGVVIEEFLADPSSEKLSGLRKKFSEMESIVSRITSSG